MKNHILTIACCILVFFILTCCKKKEKPLPEADFIADTTVIVSGDYVSFTDLTSNNPMSWYWVFGDGEYSEEQNPTHVFANAGVYSIKLKATNENGSSEKEKPNYIIVEEPPTPIFIYSPSDSSIVYGETPILFNTYEPLDVIRTEYYVNFELADSWTGIPDKVIFNAFHYPQGSTYDIQIKIITKDGQTYSSNVVTLTTSMLIKPEIDIEIVSKHKLTLRWKDDSNSETGFNVFRKTNDNDYEIIAELPENSTLYQDQDIDTTSSYTYYIQVISDFDYLNSDPLTVEFFNNKYIEHESYNISNVEYGRMRVSADGSIIIVTNYEGDEVPVLDLANHTQFTISHPGGTYAVAMSHDGNSFVTVGKWSFKKGKIWSMNNFNVISEFSVEHYPDFVVCYSKDDKYIAAGGLPIEIYDASNGNLLNTFEWEMPITRDLIYSDDQSLLLSAGNDDLVRIWNPNTGALLKTFVGHMGHVGSCRFIENTTKIISGSYEENYLRIWDVNSGQEINSFERESVIISIRIGQSEDIIDAAGNGTITVMNNEYMELQSFQNFEAIYDMDYNLEKDMICVFGVDNTPKVKTFLKIGHWEVRQP